MPKVAGPFDGVNRNVVVGTRPNNTGFFTAGDLLDAIERLTKRSDRMRGALIRIERMGQQGGSAEDAIRRAVDTAASGLRGTP